MLFKLIKLILKKQATQNSKAPYSNNELKNKIKNDPSIQTWVPCFHSTNNHHITWYVAAYKETRVLLMTD